MPRRLTWFDHSLDLSPETLAENFFTYFMTAVQRPACRPKTIWLSAVMSYHETNIGITGNNIKDLHLF